MDFEFDNEMDAILRNARAGTPAAAANAASPHVDADAIAAFAENALPDKARLTLMRHLADCDDCRLALSNVISMNTGAVATAAPAVSDAPLAMSPVPWYRRWLRSPGLAFGMGALVLGFAAILGYMALQEQQKNVGSTVSQVTDQESKTGGPSYSGESANAPLSETLPEPAANSAAAANTAANAAPSAPDLNKSGIPLSRKDQGEADEDRFADDGKVTSDAVTDVPMAAREPGALGVTSLRPETKAGQPADPAKLKTDDKEVVTEERRQNVDADVVARDAVPPPAATSGPVRAGKPKKSAPRQEVTLSATEAMSTRSVGGKTFDQRGGVWYDLAYKGQSTIGVKRGSDDYKKLDSGLRNIASSLDGVVIVVWKEKAYRIQ